jgi:hypothetical protein
MKHILAMGDRLRGWMNNVPGVTVVLQCQQ